MVSRVATPRRLCSVLVDVAVIASQSSADNRALGGHLSVRTAGCVRTTRRTERVGYGFQNSPTAHLNRCMAVWVGSPRWQRNRTGGRWVGNASPVPCLQAAVSTAAASHRLVMPKSTAMECCAKGEIHGALVHQLADRLINTCTRLTAAFSAPRLMSSPVLHSCTCCNARGTSNGNAALRAVRGMSTRFASRKGRRPSM